MSNEGSPFSVEITIQDADVQQLQQNGFRLFGFKGADGPVSKEARPLVWFTTSHYSADTKLNWTEQYGGYTSTSTAIAANTVIEASDSKDMVLGQQMNVGIGGIGDVVNGGTPGLLDIVNDVDSTFTCGITVLDPVTKKRNPICAFPLFPGSIDNFAPIEIIYLMFATQAADTGTVIEQSFERGIQVDMTGVTETPTLTFNMKTGWSGPGFATPKPARTDLLPLLINPGGPAAVSLRAAKSRKLAHARAAKH